MQMRIMYKFESSIHANENFSERTADDVWPARARPMLQLCFVAVKRDVAIGACLTDGLHGSYGDLSGVIYRGT